MITIVLGSDSAMKVARVILSVALGYFSSVWDWVFTLRQFHWLFAYAEEGEEKPCSTLHKSDCLLSLKL